MASRFYTPPDLAVDGDIAYARDVNNINAEANLALELVAGEIDGLNEYASLAAAWASADYGVEVGAGKYSALHYATNAESSAASALLSRDAAITAQGSAESAYNGALTNYNLSVIAKDEAVSARDLAIGARDVAIDMRNDADISAQNAQVYSALAVEWAEKAEDTAITGAPGHYSAYHWAQKAEENATSSLITSSVVYTVGSGGDFANLTSAIVEISKKRPIYAYPNMSILLRILSGTTISESLFFKDVDLSFLQIDSVDSVVPVSSLVAGTFISLVNSRCPKINTIFDLALAGTNKTGLSASSSSVIVSGNKGIKNSSGSNFAMASNSALIGNNLIASGAGGRGISASTCSSVSVHNANVTGSGLYGITSESGSIVSALGVNASGHSVHDFYVYWGGTIIAVSATGTLSQTANTITANGIIYQ
jgi:hypothetical protein